MANYLSSFVNKQNESWNLLNSYNLYSLVLKKGPSAAMFFAENGEESLINIAKMISKALGFQGKTVSWSIEEAIKELGDWARFAIGSNSRIKAANARNLLGWKPKAESIEEWIRTHNLIS